MLKTLTPKFTANLELWKKHPLAHFTIGILLACILGIGLISLLFLDRDFWADSHSSPIIARGWVKARFPPQFRTGTGILEILDDNDKTLAFELPYGLLASFALGDRIKVFYSPRMLHVYSIQFQDNNRNLVHDNFEPGSFIQNWQLPTFWFTATLGAAFLFALVYGIYAGIDWVLPVKTVRGALVSRLENSEKNRNEYLLELRYSRDKTLASTRTGRFKVGLEDFLKTEEALFLDLKMTPFFKFVKELKVVEPVELSKVETRLFNEVLTRDFNYHSEQNFKFSVLLNFISCSTLLGIGVVIMASRFPVWLENNREHLLYDRYILPGLAVGTLVFGFYQTASLRRKVLDLKAPRKITAGPVLSKWRVTGATNEKRRLIVVAEGGLKAGKEAIHKFEVNNTLYEELREGDIVEIEHTSQLHYILHLKVTGHQEISETGTKTESAK